MAARKQVQHRNVVVLVGTVSREPEVREMADGHTFVELDLRVSEPGVVTTVPVSWPDGTVAFGQGDEVVVIGRVRRRFWHAAGAPVSRTDVLAEQVLAPSAGKRATTAIGAAAARISA